MENIEIWKYRNYSINEFGKFYSRVLFDNLII